uniref:ATPase subunit 6 n=1 Tax=Arocatus melanocephalus TaxID=1561047 RepID=UPI002008EC84|nr:ATPase subunit 6 [Arocatus melanocephalus]UPI55355.1 ATPase subunit 6 [Arocatus melanocephalus]
MMTNLFSTFDPASTMKLSTNWISSLWCFIIMPLPYWITPNRISILMNKIIMYMYNELKTLMGNNSMGMKLMMLSLFMMIMLNNTMGLLPYVFTSSSHLTFTLALALPMWLSLMLFGWINKMNQMFSHMIPSGTPSMLMPFMVIIETISNMIRPGSLAVRLTANMIAGHLLMSLLGNNLTMTWTMPLLLLIQMMLMMFEMAVAMIQAYVFSVLSTLYSSEVI